MKRVVAMLMCSAILCTGGSLVNASESANDISVIAVEQAAEERAADVIETKYRFYNGQLQYRRWNTTKGCWVDPYWIDVP